MRNLHIEILRQFHMQEVCFSASLAYCFVLAVLSLIVGTIMQMEISSVMRVILENQAELMKEVQSLRKETQQLRQLL